MQTTGGVRAPGSPEPARRSHRFPKQDRILRRAEFVSTYENGLKRHGRFVVAFGRAGTEGRSRLGVTATRKFGKAHDRNRHKRRVREVWRTERSRAGLDDVAIDVVVNLKPAAADASFADFSQDLVRVLRRLAADLSGSE